MTVSKYRPFTFYAWVFIVCILIGVGVLFDESLATWGPGMIGLGVIGLIITFVRARRYTGKENWGAFEQDITVLSLMRRNPVLIANLLDI